MLVWLGLFKEFAVILIFLRIEDTLSGLKQFLAAKSSFKIMKNAFYFILKPVFILKILLNICPDFSVKQKIGLSRTIRLISKFMMPQPKKQTIAIHILPNIPRNNFNQTMKLVQLIEYNTRTIFLEKSDTKCVG